jgi:putative oxidoreductase
MSTALGAVFLAGRILFATFFVAVSGVGHIKRSSMMTGYAKTTGFPLPILAGTPAGLWLIAGGVSVAAGLWGDLGALMLGLFVVLAGIGFHRFWSIEDPAQRSTQRQAFWRNVALLGASLTLFAVFSSFGARLPLTVTKPLFHLAETR